MVTRGFSVEALAQAARETALRIESAPVEVRPKCPKCKGRLSSDESAIGVCLFCASPGSVTDPYGSIPAKFRWARLDAPLIPPGSSVEIGSRALRDTAFEWIRSATQVLMVHGSKLEDGTAPTGVGKTSFAAAVARACVDAGWRVLWVRAAELGPVYEDRHRKILDSVVGTGRAVVVVDGLGKELAGAKLDSGIITQRLPAMQELIALTYELTKTRFIFTSDVTGKMLKDAYGADAVRRIVKAPNATAIELRGAQ